MRIALLNDNIELVGGVEIYLAVVREALIAAGHAVEIISTRDAARALAAVAAFKPDIVHLNKVGEVALVAAVAARWPAVMMEHDYSGFTCPGSGRYLPGPRRACERPFGAFCAVAPWIQRCGSRHPVRHGSSVVRMLEMRRMATDLRRILVASASMKETLVGSGIAAEQVEVVGYALTATAKPLLPPGEVPVVTLIGRLYPQKGVDLALEALLALKAPCRIEVIGDGNRAPVERAAAHFDAGHPVTLRGWLDRAATVEALRATSVVVVPSLWPEPFGLVGLEAAAFGLPVVGFDTGGVREWLQDGMTGLLVRAGDKAGLAAAVERLLGDRDLRERFGQAGIALANSRFAADVHVRGLAACFAQVLR